MNRDVIIIGAGGHSKVIADIIIKSNDKVLGFLDDAKGIGMEVIENIKLNTPSTKSKVEENEYNGSSNFTIIGKIKDIPELVKKHPKAEYIIAIGNNYTREKIYEENKKYNLKYYTAIHPNSNIGLNVKIGEGTAIMANACINSEAKIGKHCIINTGALIEHDNELGDFVHISPNATLCGTVKIGNYTHIGAGATVRNDIDIASDVVIGCGSCVVKNITDSGTYIGVPAQKLK